MLHRLLLPTIIVLAVCSQAVGQRTPGIVGSPAPEWAVTEWINLPEGEQTLNIDDFKGKVLYLYCFQSWCPGCHKYGFPTLQTLIDQYDDVDDVAFVAVQTTFEGAHINTAAKAWETARDKSLTIPVGHSGSAGQRSLLMQRYRTGGTPWTILIDKTGAVRWNGFHLTPENAARLIDRLRQEEPADAEPETAIVTLPASRGGQDRVGEAFPAMRFDGWARRAAKKDNAHARPKATLYRWWTDQCGFCKASLPAIEQLRREFEPQGLEVVAVYHPKPARDVSDRAILNHAAAFDYAGDVAVDFDWSELRRAYATMRNRGATSVSFLVDSQGMIRFVHPGPVFFPSEDPRHGRENSDFAMLRSAIEALLDENTRTDEPPAEDEASG